MAGGQGRRIVMDVPDAEIVALADPNSQNLAAFTSSVFGDGKRPEQTFADHTEMLKSVELDGVVIVSPHNLHYQQSVDALNAGRHVLVQKPMVIRTEDAQSLIALAEEKQKVLSVAFPGPFTKEFMYIRDVIERGELGDIYLVTGVCAQNWMELNAGTWRTVQEIAGGGNLYDSGAHMFNAMLYLTGLAATKVFAFVDNKGHEVDMTAAVSIQLTKGALGSAVVSGDSPKFEQGIYIQGTQGSIKCSIYGGGEVLHWRGKDLMDDPPLPDAVPMEQNFVDVIRGKAVTPSPPLLGLRQARLMDAIYESARTGQVVNVVADEEASN